MNETPKKLREEILKRDNYTCVYCGKTGIREVDHVIPKSKGGTNEKYNGLMHTISDPNLITSILNALGLAEFPEERAKREALLSPMKQEQGGTIGLSYWGSVVDNARDVAERGNLQEISLILPLLHSACELLLVSSDDAKRKKEQSRCVIRCRLS